MHLRVALHKKLPTGLEFRNHIEEKAVQHYKDILP